MTYDFRAFHRQASDVSTPQAAAAVISAKLEPIFAANFFKVEFGRGIRVQFARMDPEQHAKLQFTQGYYSVPPNMRCLVTIVPNLGSDTWRDLNLKFAGSATELLELKTHGVAFRKAGGLTPEKAVASLVKWFTTNAAKLKG